MAITEDFDPHPEQQLGMTVRTAAVVLLDDQNHRLEQGEPVSPEEYLRREPALHSNPELLLDLIYNEVRLREQRGESPEWRSIAVAFPNSRSCWRSSSRFIERRSRISFSTTRVPTTIAAHRPHRCRRLPVMRSLPSRGCGAMGVVYKARHLRLNRLVAIKMILAGPHAGGRERARFDVEAQAIARLQHPHIVQIHEIGEEEGRPFVCLELVAGGSLAKRLAGRPLQARQAAALAETMAGAVHYAHEQQIAHRDLKPANVLLARSDARRGIRLGGAGEAAYFEPKITDFGLAKLLDREADASNAECSSRPARSARRPTWPRSKRIDHATIPTPRRSATAARRTSTRWERCSTRC